MSMWKKVLALLLVCGLIAAGCGDDDGTPEPGSDDPSQTDDDGTTPESSDDGEEPGDDGTTPESSDDGEEPSDDGTTPESSDDGEESGDDGEETTPALGELNPAVGDPIKVGFVSDGQSDAIDNSSETPAGRAAAAYVNDYLGGAGGRPIELVTCETNQTPAGAQDCVAELASEGVVAVLSGVSGQGETLSGELNEIGIPYMITGAISQQMFGAQRTFVITNGLSTLVGPAAIAQENGLAKAGVIVIDVPAAVDPINVAAPLFYGNVGVEVEVVPIAPGTPDMTPQVQAAISKDVEQFAIIGDETFCISAMQAIQTLGFEGETIVISTCVSEVTVAAVDMEGIRLMTTVSDDPADSEVALFHNVMEEYAPAAVEDSIAKAGYSVVLAFARAMASNPDGDVSTDSVLATVIGMAPAPLPLGANGTTFQCNRMAVALAPAICSSSSAITTLDANGNGTGFSEVDLTPVLSLGG